MCVCSDCAAAQCHVSICLEFHWINPSNSNKVCIIILWQDHSSCIWHKANTRCAPHYFQNAFELNKSHCMSWSNSVDSNTCRLHVCMGVVVIYWCMTVEALQSSCILYCLSNYGEHTSSLCTVHVHTLYMYNTCTCHAHVSTGTCNYVTTAILNVWFPDVSSGNDGWRLSYFKYDLKYDIILEPKVWYHTLQSMICKGLISWTSEGIIEGGYLASFFFGAPNNVQLGSASECVTSDVSGSRGTNFASFRHKKMLKDANWRHFNRKSQWIRKVLRQFSKTVADPRWVRRKKNLPCVYDISLAT